MGIRLLQGCGPLRVTSRGIVFCRAVKLPLRRCCKVVNFAKHFEVLLAHA